VRSWLATALDYIQLWIEFQLGQLEQLGASLPSRNAAKSCLMWHSGSLTYRQGHRSLRVIAFGWVAF
jgi:hypothetical protein